MGERAKEMQTRVLASGSSLEALAIILEYFQDEETGLGGEDVRLGNNLHGISVTWILSDGFELEGQMIDIDELADQYPDCEVGY